MAKTGGFLGWMLGVWFGSWMSAIIFGSVQVGLLATCSIGGE